jgi:hypothetical protein
MAKYSQADPANTCDQCGTTYDKPICTDYTCCGLVFCPNCREEYDDKWRCLHPGYSAFVSDKNRDYQH